MKSKELKISLIWIIALHYCNGYCAKSHEPKFIKATDIFACKISISERGLKCCFVTIFICLIHLFNQRLIDCSHIHCA